MKIADGSVFDWLSGKYWKPSRISKGTLKIFYLDLRWDIVRFDRIISEERAVFSSTYEERDNFPRQFYQIEYIVYLKTFI